MSVYPTPYLNLQRRITTFPPVNPLREMLRKIKSIPAPYPPKLLKSRRAAFMSQIKKRPTP